MFGLLEMCCIKLKKEGESEKRERDGQIDRQTDRQRQRKRDRETDRKKCFECLKCVVYR